MLAASPVTARQARRSAIPGKWRYELLVEGRPVVLPEGETQLGRSRGCALPLKDPAVSRHHAVVTARSGRVTIADLNSSNGTFVNGSRLMAATDVLDGDQVTLGETVIVLRIHPQAEAGDGDVEVVEREEGVPVGDVLARISLAGAQAPTPPSGSRAAAPAPARPAPPERAEVLPSIRGIEATPAPVPVRGAAQGPSRALTRPSFPPAAGFWVRLAAYLVDGAWILLAAVGSSFLAGGPLAPRGSLVAVAVAAALFLLVPLVGWSVWGTTPGKRLLRLYVCTVDGTTGVGFGRALLRWVGYLLSGALFGVGFLMIAFDATRRGLHDRIAGTYVGRR